MTHPHAVDEAYGLPLLAGVGLEVEGVQVLDVVKGKDARKGEQKVEHEDEQVVGRQQLWRIDALH